ncbi:V-type ATP synthase subunit E [Halegenticoccus soli]|uniref:V-type ATP synthase subunit E n=1 Tax=Halegenticoccus soli TaxID=1985678 RepID=UPI000C6D4792|nr:V-type ATP synthase subunit E [Halegenticoccus soli]
MSLETVAEDIRDEARARAEDIRSEGERRAEEIVADAEADAERILEEREAAAERRIAQEREQALSSAKLEAKQERLEARRDVLQRVREEVETGLVELDGTKREELTRALLDAAAAEFDGDDDVRVYGRADDEQLLTSILDEYDGFGYAGERDCLGGVVVESTASRVRVNNTFDSILEEVWEDNLKELSARLFEQ